MSDTLREQMLASATEAVNTLCGWAHDQLMSDFDAHEKHVLKHVLKPGRELMPSG